MKLVQSKRKLENNVCFKIKQDIILETYLTCLDLNLNLNMAIEENVGYGYTVANALSFPELF